MGSTKYGKATKYGNKNVRITLHLLPICNKKAFVFPFYLLVFIYSTDTSQTLQLSMPRPYSYLRETLHQSCKSFMA